MFLRVKQAMSSLITPIAGQDHDVHGRVRVEPEHVLEQDRVAAERGVEDADAETRSTPSSRIVIAITGVASTWIRLVA